MVQKNVRIECIICGLIYNTVYDGRTGYDGMATAGRIGPPPGYLVGGPNFQYSGSIASVLNERTNNRAQKVFQSINYKGPAFDYKPWELTECGIYYQACYIRLLASVMSRGTNCGVVTCPVPNLEANQNICNNPSTIILNSTIATGTNKTFTWGRGSTVLTLNSATENTYTLNSPITLGKYWVKDDSAASCSRIDTIEIGNSLGVVDLGANKNLCTPSGVNLDAGFVGAGYTYEWSLASDFTFANLIVIADSIKRTLSNVRTRGLYRVIVRNAANTCSSSDTITITSNLPTPIDACISAAGSITVSISNPGLGAGPYQWYDQAIGGSLLFTGNSYTSTVSSSTTFYVRDASSSLQSVGLTSYSPSSAWNNLETTAFAELDKHQRLTVLSNTTLSELTVGVANNNTNVTVNITNASGTILNTATFTNLNAGNRVLSGLNFNLTPGTYYITFVGTNNILNFEGWNNTNRTYTYPYTIPGVVELDMRETYAEQGYGPAYNLKFSSSSVCDRLPVLANVGGCGSALPLSIQRITAEFQNDGVLLNWTSVTNSLIDYFEIYKSNNGIDFTKLGYVKATSDVNYFYFDSSTQVAGTIYYKVKEVDRNGREFFTTPVNLNLTSQYELYPNPANDFFYVKVPNIQARYKLTLFNSAGVEIKSLVANNMEQNGFVYFQTVEIPAGLYLLKISNETIVDSYKIQIIK